MKINRFPPKVRDFINKYFKRLCPECLKKKRLRYVDKYKESICIQCYMRFTTRQDRRRMEREVIKHKNKQQAKYAKPLKCSDGCGATVNVPGKCLCCSGNN